VEPELVATLVWAGLFLFFLIVECLSVQLVSVWFMIGSLIAFALSFIPGFPLWAQILVFVLISLAMVVCLRPLVRKIIPKRDEHFNSDGYVGREYFLIKSIGVQEPGEIKIGDIIYSAKSAVDGLTIEIGQLVRVVKIQGNTLYVTKE